MNIILAGVIVAYTIGGFISACSLVSFFIVSAAHEEWVFPFSLYKGERSIVVSSWAWVIWASTSVYIAVKYVMVS
jgi:hypothetical protein